MSLPAIGTPQPGPTLCSRHSTSHDRHCFDDSETPTVSWPNYRSGAIGDFQVIEIVGELHPVLMDPEAEGSVLRYLPAHPHEGVVGTLPAIRAHG